jgi:hypothetical protein
VRSKAQGGAYSFSTPLQSRHRTHTHQGPLETVFDFDLEPSSKNYSSSSVSSSASHNGQHYFNRSRRTLSMVQPVNSSQFYSNHLEDFAARHSVEGDPYCPSRHRSESFTCVNSFMDNLAVHHNCAHYANSPMPSGSSSFIQAIPSAIPRSVSKDRGFRNPLPISKPLQVSIESGSISSHTSSGSSVDSNTGINDDSSGKRLPVFRSIS